jgi:hypothetical protein
MLEDYFVCTRQPHLAHSMYHNYMCYNNNVCTSSTVCCTCVPELVLKKTTEISSPLSHLDVGVIIIYDGICGFYYPLLGHC